MTRSHTLLSVTILISALLTGCNLPSQDVGAIQTAAAQTVQAELTAAAPAVTATFTLAPFPTLPPITATIPNTAIPPSPTSASSCDRADFVSETVPDDTVLAANEAFVKTWTLKNIGTCSWTPAYTLVFVSGDALNGPASVALTGNINTNQTVSLTASLKAPASNGTYRGNWGLRNASGVIFSSFWVQIKVGGGSGGPFAVTSVNYVLSTWSDAGHTNCPRVKTSITTNGAGTVTYKWTRQDTPGGGSLQSLDFASAGTQTVNYDWSRGSVWAGTSTWVGLYVDDPNNQDFGRLNFDTACTSP